MSKLQGSPGFGHQVIIGMADDADAGEFAQGQLAANMNPAVDVGRVGFGAGQSEVPSSGFRVPSFEFAEQAVFPRKYAGTVELFCAGPPLDEHLERATDNGFAHGAGNFLLLGHRAGAALFLHAVRDLACHPAGASSVFLRVSENAEPLELRLADEIEQCLEALFAFTGEP